MKYLLLFFSLLLSANGLLAEQRSNSAPKRFDAEFVSMGASYAIKLQKGALVCTKSSLGKETRVKISPTKEQWAEFRRTLDKAGAWHWRTNYLDPNIMDGMYWSLTADYPDRSIRASGRNSYPDEAGKAGKPISGSLYTRAFDAYTRALDKLTGGKFMKE